MKRKWFINQTLTAVFTLWVLTACTVGSDISPSTQQQINQSPSSEVTQMPDQVDWPLHGNDNGELRFSSLKQINAGNVEGLGLAWFADIGIDGHEATSIVVDGVIYISTGLSVVYAVDGATGETLWLFDPMIRRDMGFFNSWNARFNRGVAVQDGKVYVGTADCRLIAIDAKTGKAIWDVVTCDATQDYGIASAPRVGNGKVYIGNSGADSGTRGYVSAYDGETGEMAWRFWLVPGDPADGYENAAMEMAAKTWTGKEPWKYGGGNVWDSMSFDPELNLLYLGTASTNALAGVRSPEGGDNLFLCSIVAVDADTGEYRWHYQTTPGEAWHYDAANQMILSDLTIDGQERKVLMQAPKNGFFYVLDRVTGELISANNFVEVNWATGIDIETGRPIENPEARFYQTEAREFQLKPLGTVGAHSWYPMSFNPETGLVYLPAHGMPGWYRMGESKTFEGATAEYYGVDPDDTEALNKIGKLLAWDPLTQSARWQVDHQLPMNGGVLSSSGNLVFQGTAMGEFHIYHAETGELLWSHDTQSAVQAPPVTYAIDGVQYVLLPVGAGGSGRISAPAYGNGVKGPSRLLAYKLNGSVTLPLVNWEPELPEPPKQTSSAEVVAQGKNLFDSAGCKVCHGVLADIGWGSTIRDLRYLTKEGHAQWNDVVLGGSRKILGMPSFKEWLSEEESRALQAFVIEQANKAWAEEQASKKQQAATQQ